MQQLPSIFSTLKTFEQVVVLPVHVAVESLVVGILHGVPLPEQV